MNILVQLNLNNQLPLRVIYSILLLIHQDKKRKNHLINLKRNLTKRNENHTKIVNQNEIFKLNILNMLQKKRKTNHDQIFSILFAAKMLKKLKENENSQFNQ